MQKALQKMRKSRRRVFIIAIIVAIVAIAVIAYFIYPKTTTPNFVIVSKDIQLAYEDDWVYYVYARVKNVYGAQNNFTIYCELTKFDSSTITKSQVVYLQKDEVKVVLFVFYANEFGGKTPRGYRFYG